ncbi:hypothetical protein [Mucilaginibacter auburnensis]|uniref:Tubulin-like protein n=1 Tax=Mucilaginibacter auburnensis TaxID=1457233 RepID=A0A2H9VRQ9_9SPHI|nr:hypothetical protein [Mucilaginibacter auburnensis]PJJ83517.1 hypothetical protein CLV57_0500 [Mucilaginibacter auburnensis]
MRVFVFGIGGTGARVLRSLAMLLASGLKLDHSNLEIIPIIIDMDAHNGDTARTRDVFRSYHTIRKAFVAAGANSQSDSFFNTIIKPFNRLDSNASDITDIDLQFDFQNRTDTFAQFIQYNTLDQSNKDILELLYNDSTNPADFPELHLDLSVGFKGNPNIGSVVFNDLAASPEFKNLESAYTVNDRIFIVSSIFGGTGSSGFPTLVKLIRNSTNPHLKGTKLGAVTVMPYFNVDAVDDSAIKSALFTTKTKAALSFYENDTDIRSINALYYIADPNQTGSLPNVEGGREQINDAHVIELLAATAITDFISKQDEQLATPAHYEFGAETDSNPLTIAHLSPNTKERYIKPLVRFAYAAQIATKFVPRLSDNRFYGPKELNISAKMGLPNEYHKLLSFFESFKKWVSAEMSNSRNGRVLNTFLFDDPETLNNMIVGKSIPSTWLAKGLTQSKIAEKLNKFLDKEQANLPAPQKYQNILFKTATDCLDVLGQLP